MNSVRPSGALKAQAREQLLGNYSIVISALLVIECIIFFATLVSTSFTDTTTVIGSIFYLLISFILQLLAGIFNVGKTQLFFHVACSKKPTLQDIFTGFKNHPDKAILIQFILLLAGILPLLPVTIVLLLYYYTQNIFLIPIIAIALAFGIIVSCILSLSFAQVYCLMLDFPHYTVRELFTTSMSLMKGHKGQLFYLWVSFLPLYLAGFMTCGIGLLWIIPYINSTSIFFYLDLIRTNTPNPDSGMFINEVC